MPAKTWIEIRAEVGGDIRRQRFAFLQEHENASTIETTKEGIPLKATYHSSEFHEPRTDIPLMENTPQPFKPKTWISQIRLDKGSIFINGVEMKGMKSMKMETAEDTLTMVTMELYVEIER